MPETTIVASSPVGQQLSEIKKGELSFLMFNKKKIALAAEITVGRDSDNNVLVDNKLASRHHCVIQKIKDAYFLKDENSTNGTFLNGSRIPPDKYVRLNPGDRITVGGETIVMS